MSWKSLNSTMSGAPSLTGQTGALLTVLDAVLADGFGAYSGLGWSKQFTGTNKRVYRAGAAARCRSAFRILDDASLTAGAKEAGIIVAESFSDVDTASNTFSFGPVVRKSATADATSRPWYAFGDERTVIFAALTGDQTGSNYWFVQYIGEFYSLLVNDGYQACHAGRDTANSANTAPDGFSKTVVGMNNTVATPFCKIARDHFGIAGGGIGANRIVPAWTWSAYPNPVDGGAYLCSSGLQTYVSSTAQMRGRIRGVWRLMHDYTVFSGTYGDTISGTGSMAGKSFTLLRTADTQWTAFETSDTVPAS